MTQTQSQTANHIAPPLLAELDHEAATTRAMLAVVPEDRAIWRPHGRSMSLGGLAIHLTEVPQWGVVTVAQTAFDVAPVGGPAYAQPEFTTTAAMLGLWDANLAAFRAALAQADDAAMLVPWSLLKAGQPVFTMPRVATLRSFIFNHLYHHRGQLSVYLRLCNVKLPQVYGPTADDLAGM